MVSQVLVRPSAGNDAPAVHVDPLDAERPRDARELHFGSQDLIRLAGYSLDRGFVVTGFSVADAWLSQLDAAEQHTVSDLMVEILGTYGWAELSAAMQDEFDGLYVTAVALLSKTTGLRIEVRRDGYVDTSVIDEAQQLLDSAWKDLDLS